MNLINFYFWSKLKQKIKQNSPFLLLEDAAASRIISHHDALISMRVKLQQTIYCQLIYWLLSQ